MNQILVTKSPDFINVKSTLLLKKINYFLIIFIICITIIVLCFVYVIIHKIRLLNNESAAASLYHSFGISKLYSNSLNYSVTVQNTDIYESSNSNFVIGIIEIDKINLHYPILSYSSEEYLKISPCRFAGPEPNKIGNLCIAGHNNADNSFFGRLYLLSINDIIKIYNINGSMLEYSIYDKFEILNNDLSCISQETYKKRVLTLMTCNTLTDTRIILKAVEKNS